MKVSKRSLVVVIVALTLLALVAPVAAWAEEIPPGPDTVLPDYIGQPAKAHPLPNSGVPQDPNFAPNPFPHGHSDIWMSDTADLAGPLGRNPVVSSTTLPGIQRPTWLASGGNLMFDSHGRPVIFV